MESSEEEMWHIGPGMLPLAVTLSPNMRNSYTRLSEPDREVKYTFWLIFSVTICVFGNSFLYGYNIGVVNSPANLIKDFYTKVFLDRHGVETKYINNTLFFGFSIAGEEDGNVTTTTMAPVVTVVPLGGNASEFNTTGNDTAKGPSGPIKAEIEGNLLDLMWSVTVAIFVLFGMIGAFSSGKIADYFGRKIGMIIITVIMFLAAVFGGIPTVASSPECLIVSRALVGLHCGINISLASLYLAEISPKSIRGAVGTCHQLFITMGILWSMIMGLPEFVGNWGSWPVLFAFNAFPALVCLIFMPFCPESPRFLLIKKNDEDSARKALRRLRGYDDVDDEMDEMRIEARKASSVEQFTLKKLLTTPELKMPLIIAVLMQVAQQWSGINAAMSYSVFIFQQSNVPEDTIPYVIVGQGAINVVATIIALPLMEKLGRRPLLLWPMCGMVVSFVILTVCLALLEPYKDLDEIGRAALSPEDQQFAKSIAIVCIVVMLTYVIGFALGLGPIAFIVVSEIFRQEPRAAAMSFSLAFNWICNFILMLTFPFIIKGIGAYTYLIFVIILVASIIFIFFFVPETKNRTFDDIARAIGRGGRGGNKPFQEEGGEELQPMGEAEKA